MNSSTTSMVDSVSKSTRVNREESHLHLDISATTQEDISAFRNAMQNHMGIKNPIAPVSGTASGGKGTLSSAIAERAQNLATSVNKDQQYVSKLLEQATRTGSSMDLMKAMMALNDYQLRVQTISKSVSKAASSVDQLTKLQ